MEKISIQHKPGLQLPGLRLPNLLFLLVCSILILAVASCSPATGPVPLNPTALAETENPTSTIAILPTSSQPSPLSSTEVLAPIATEAPAFSPTSTEAQTVATALAPTEIPTLAPSESPAATPTYSILRGEVLVRANCRYGPGEPYLYKYGLMPGSNLEVIGRNDPGTWILVRAIGENNPCWVKASLMKVKGEVMSVAPTVLPLPPSPYYGPPATVLATRAGKQVTVFWTGVPFRAGDETASAPYLIEAWICKNGQLEFTPIGSYETVVNIVDEPGCSEPSHGRLYTVEKHGYSRWIKIPWPESE